MKNLLVAFSVILSCAIASASAKDTDVTACLAGKQNSQQVLVILEKYTSNGYTELDALRQEVQKAVKNGGEYVITVETLVDAGLDLNEAVLLIGELNNADSNN